MMNDSTKNSSTTKGDLGVNDGHHNRPHIFQPTFSSSTEFTIFNKIQKHELSHFLPLQTLINPKDKQSKQQQKQQNEQKQQQKSQQKQNLIRNNLEKRSCQEKTHKKKATQEIRGQQQAQSRNIQNILDKSPKFYENLKKKSPLMNLQNKRSPTNKTANTNNFPVKQNVNLNPKDLNKTKKEKEIINPVNLADNTNPNPRSETKKLQGMEVEKPSTRIFVDRLNENKCTLNSTDRSLYPQTSQNQNQTQTQTIRPAFEYVQSVQKRLANQPESFEDFCDFLRQFRKGFLSTEQIFTKLTQILSGHNDLILEFNQFLPIEYQKKTNTKRTNMTFDFIYLIKKNLPKEDFQDKCNQFYQFLRDYYQSKTNKISNSSSDQKLFESISKLFNGNRELAEKFKHFFSNDEQLRKINQFTNPEKNNIIKQQQQQQQQKLNREQNQNQNQKHEEQQKRNINSSGINSNDKKQKLRNIEEFSTEIKMKIQKPKFKSKTKNKPKFKRKKKQDFIKSKQSKKQKFLNFQNEEKKLKLPKLIPVKIPTLQNPLQLSVLKSQLFSDNSLFSKEDSEKETKYMSEEDEEEEYEDIYKTKTKNKNNYNQNYNPNQIKRGNKLIKNKKIIQKEIEFKNFFTKLKNRKRNEKETETEIENRMMKIETNFYFKKVITKEQFLELCQKIELKKNQHELKNHVINLIDQVQQNQLNNFIEYGNLINQRNISLNDSLSCTPSYRQIPIKYQHLSSSKNLNPLINLEWTSIPSGGEEEVSKTFDENNPWHDRYLKCEEERYELDILIYNNLRSIQKLKEFLKEFEKEKKDQDNKANTISRYRHNDDKVISNPKLKMKKLLKDALFKKSIKIIYGKQFNNIFLNFYNSPKNTTYIVLERLKQKQFQLQNLQNNLFKDWNYTMRYSFSGTINFHNGLFLRSENLNFNRSKYYGEIYNLKVTKKTKKIKFQDQEVLKALIKLLKLSLKNFRNTRQFSFLELIIEDNNKRDYFKKLKQHYYSTKKNTKNKILEFIRVFFEVLIISNKKKNQNDKDLMKKNVNDNKDNETYDNMEMDIETKIETETKMKMQMQTESEGEINEDKDDDNNDNDGLISEENLLEEIYPIIKDIFKKNQIKEHYTFNGNEDFYYLFKIFELLYIRLKKIKKLSIQENKRLLNVKRIREYNRKNNNYFKNNYQISKYSNNNKKSRRKIVNSNSHNNNNDDDDNNNNNNNSLINPFQQYIELINSLTEQKISFKEYEFKVNSLFRYQSFNTLNIDKIMNLIIYLIIDLFWKKETKRLLLLFLRKRKKDPNSNSKIDFSKVKSHIYTTNFFQFSFQKVINNNIKTGQISLKYIQPSLIKNQNTINNNNFNDNNNNSKKNDQNYHFNNSKIEEKRKGGTYISSVNLDIEISDLNFYDFEQCNNLSNKFKIYLNRNKKLWMKKIPKEEIVQNVDPEELEYQMLDAASENVKILNSIKYKVDLKTLKKHYAIGSEDFIWRRKKNQNQN
ncbi:paired amphipathic helix sin3-like protein-related [Anaeramoeba flamelloides]|uniref:Paired amphipathic helix sin3-like protein-related n=1 Tax=Anaeramoeba flamelloides TaxID=1746091 RepID=A0AAV7YY44_9EUKA|nr:paired amphipathic helix sin3-like protein-related [Anaeramoeba flamelloides]